MLRVTVIWKRVELNRLCCIHFDTSNNDFMYMCISETRVGIIGTSCQNIKMFETLSNKAANPFVRTRSLSAPLFFSKSCKKLLLKFTLAEAHVLVCSISVLFFLILFLLLARNNTSTGTTSILG